MAQKNFFDFFPPPRFITMPAVGLSISDDAVRFVEYNRALKGLELKRFGERILPPSVVRYGHIEDSNTLVKILKEIKNKHKFDFVYTALPEEKAYLFQTEVPVVSPKEIQETIEFKIEENVPLSLSEVVFDYYVTGSSHTAKGLDVVVCVLPAKVSTVYVDVLRAAGLTPLSLEIESQAIARAAVKKEDKRAILIVNLSNLKTGFYIVNEEIVHFSSTITRGNQFLFGGITPSYVDHSLREMTSAKRGKETADQIQLGKLGKKEEGHPLSIENTRVEELKEEKKDEEKKIVSARTEIEKEKLSTTFKPEAASIFSDTAKKFISYWQTYKGNKEKKSIEKIIICGSGSSSEEFANYLGNQTGTPTEVASVWTNAFSFDEYVPPVTFDESLDYVLAAGLALTPYKQ
ncbi:MAG: pilus assembly protein PilM [Candidatus Pacebacteria bacterium]|nr:pilus assembly protein PilM [Candidatus Paceibacterota bacterium]